MCRQCTGRGLVPTCHPMTLPLALPPPPPTSAPEKGGAPSSSPRHPARSCPVLTGPPHPPAVVLCWDGNGMSAASWLPASAKGGGWTPLSGGRERGRGIQLCRTGGEGAGGGGVQGGEKRGNGRGRALRPHPSGRSRPWLRRAAGEDRRGRSGRRCLPRAGGRPGAAPPRQAGALDPLAPVRTAATRLLPLSLSLSPPPTLEAEASAEASAEADPPAA